MLVNLLQEELLQGGDGHEVDGVAAAPAVEGGDLAVAAPGPDEQQVGGCQ